MIFRFGNITVDADVEQTRLFYENASLITDSCRCADCRNFEAAADQLPFTVKRFFADLGVDLKKICECYTLSTGPDGWVCYGGFCHICGILLKGNESFYRIRDNSNPINHKPAAKRNYWAAFSDRADLLEDGFPMPVLQIDFKLDVPWVLEPEQQSSNV
ncbi:MAG: hypothetical protein IKG46_04140 [Solobacterium sp.]|nr:hypothetical protein [Solobacterium sp.]